MNTSTKRTHEFGSAAGKIAIALASVVAIGSVTVSPAFGQYDRRSAQERGRYDDRNQNYYRSQNQRYDRRDQRGRAYEHPYHYSQPVYAPPPAYYYPNQRPGIAIQSP